MIVTSNKFCEYWNCERTMDALIPPRNISASADRLRTRFQAFVESVESKNPPDMPYEMK